MSATPPSASVRGGDPPRPLPLALLFPLFFTAIYLSHWTLLRLPYFWDEGGYYIPAALDFFQTGTLVPTSTLTNAHPPLPSILLAAWWHLSGFVLSGTRTFLCMVSATALLGVYRLGRNLSGALTGASVAVLTAIYPVWFAQSTLAHADMFAAAFTVWGLSFYLDCSVRPTSRRTLAGTCLLFAAAALSKETAILTPLVLAVAEFTAWLRSRSKVHARWSAALLTPLLPLLAWYGYHKHKTGFVFGNPEFLRYNATANLEAYRVLLALWHRTLHLTMHMNMFVPVLCTFAALFAPLVAGSRFSLPPPAVVRIVVVLVANTVAFSVLGGALLTRYLLPLFPLLLLLCVSTWRSHLRHWGAPALLTAAAFLVGIWINPPYSFAPEDNLTYRDMIVLHMEAIAYLNAHYPNATVLSAWPASAELEHPQLGYTRRAFRTDVLQNFSMAQMEKAAEDPGAFDTALLFSTKWEPPPGKINLAKRNTSADTRYFDFHHDLSPEEAAALLHGTVVWQDRRKGEWAAVLHFPRIVNASLEREP